MQIIEIQPKCEAKKEKNSFLFELYKLHKRVGGKIIPLPQIFVAILLKKETDMPVKPLRGTCVTCKK